MNIDAEDIWAIYFAYKSTSECYHLVSKFRRIVTLHGTVTSLAFEEPVTKTSKTAILHIWYGWIIEDNMWWEVLNLVNYLQATLLWSKHQISLAHHHHFLVNFLLVWWFQGVGFVRIKLNIDICWLLVSNAANLFLNLLTTSFIVLISPWRYQASITQRSSLNKGLISSNYKVPILLLP